MNLIYVCQSNNCFYKQASSKNNITSLLETASQNLPKKEGKAESAPSKPVSKPAVEAKSEEKPAAEKTKEAKTVKSTKSALSVSCLDNVC